MAACSPERRGPFRRWKFCRSTPDGGGTTRSTASGSLLRGRERESSVDRVLFFFFFFCFNECAAAEWQPERKSKNPTGHGLLLFSIVKAQQQKKKNLSQRIKTQPKTNFTRASTNRAKISANKSTEKKSTLCG